MDIANYLSELLGRHGKVSLPGLGHFTQVRVNGYYNDAEKQFYPPGNQIQFHPELLDDDILVQYIAEKKNISLASSKYFTEKYITGLKQELALTEVAFANLGWFYMDQDQVAFKPQEKNGDGPDFYGYAPVTIKKLIQEPEKVVPPPPPFVLPAQAPAANQPQEYIVEEPEEKKRSISTWVIALIIIVIIAAVTFGLDQYNPFLFNFDQQTAKPIAEQPKTQSAAPIDSVDTIVNKTAPSPVDTTTKAISKADTTLNKPVANAGDTVAQPQYVIFAGSFKKVATSDLAIKNYKSIGVDARILTGPGSGRLIKVIIGSFATYKEGEALRLKLVKLGKLRKDSYTQIINQKK